MKKITLITACLCALMCVSCISLYSTGSYNSYYSDGIYYVPSKQPQQVVVIEQEPTIVETPVVVNSAPSPRVIEGYWLGGWDGSNSDLKRAYRIIENYPNGFGYMTNGADVAQSMAFSSDWNVFVADGRYWWFPTSSNYAMYTDFLFGPYPSSDLIFFDYSPYKWRVGVRFGATVGVTYSWGRGWYSTRYYAPWFYDPWFYDPWFYDPWHYDPWHHHYHHYGPYYGPHYGPGPHHGPHYGPGYGPGYRPYPPQHIRPQKPQGRPDGPGNGPKPNQNRPQGQWRPTTTPGGEQILRPGTTQRPSVGGGVVGGNGAPPKRDNKEQGAVRPSNNNTGTGTRVETSPKKENNKSSVTRPTNSNRVNITRPSKSNSNRTTVTRPTNSNTNRANITRPSNSSSSRVTRPTNSGSYRSGGFSRPTGGGAIRSGGGGGSSRVSRTR